MGGIGIWQLVIIAVIVLLLFGSKKLRGLGGDLGAALRGFKKEMHDDKDKDKEADTQNVEHKQVDAEFREDESRKKPEHDHSKRD